MTEGHETEKRVGSKRKTEGAVWVPSEIEKGRMRGQGKCCTWAKEENREW